MKKPKEQFKMTEEQKALFDKLTTLQQQIALNSISGMSDIDSYKNSSGKAKTIKAMEASVSQILGNVKVVAFLDAMKEVAVNNAIMSREEMMTELSILSRVKTSDIINFGYRDVETVDPKTGETKIVNQSYWSMKDMEDLTSEELGAIEEVSVGKDGLKFKKVSRLNAMKQLSELAGYNAAQKYDHTSSDGSMSPKGKTLDDFYAESSDD